MNTLKKDWNPSKWSLSHIFEVVKCLLIVPFPESSLNDEAGRQFMSDYNKFCETARVYTNVHAQATEATKHLLNSKAQSDQNNKQIEEEKQ